MAESNLTLRDVLTQKKPAIPYNRPPIKNSRNDSWPQVLQSITTWDDFNLKNLNESYGHVLDLTIPTGMQPLPAPNRVLTGVSIDKALDIRHLTCWNNQIIQPTLNFAKRALRLEPGISIDYVAGTADDKVRASLPVPHHHLVDHVIMLDDFQTLVVGIGRPSQWSGRKLMQQLPNPTLDLLWPVRQLAQLCRHGKTRYGYIQTKEELTVFRFAPRVEPRDKNWQAAIMSIPWARSGCDALTTDLALWWLCMLAISGHHHRSLTCEQDMVSLSAWDTVYLDQERGWARRHQYSNVEVPTSPPPPPPYETPSVGNVAAFEAGVGLNARDDFNIHGFDMGNTLDTEVNIDDVDINDGNFNDVNFNDVNLNDGNFNDVNFNNVHINVVNFDDGNYDLDLGFDVDDANLFLERNMVTLNEVQQ